MSNIGLSAMLNKDLFTPDRTTATGRLEGVVSTAEEFDLVVSQALPLLLDRAAGYTKRFLRETGQWSDDVAHEKFVLRWGAEYLEQFLVTPTHEDMLKIKCAKVFIHQVRADSVHPMDGQIDRAGPATTG